jgi:hypothetical protein
MREPVPEPLDYVIGSGKKAVSKCAVYGTV